MQLEVLQMFLFLFKSKYRRKSTSLWNLVRLISISYICCLVTAKCPEHGCGEHGECKNETCMCFDGWQGPECQFCGGKVRLSAPSGIIHDGHGNYSIGVKCSWLIDAPPKSNITLHLEEFATECGWDHLYIFDGDSVDSPLLAVFSGLMYKGNYSIRRIPEVVAKSGSALIHFFSDDAYNMSGFNMTYRLNACPSVNSSTECSGHGVCIDGTCTCDGKWNGLACHLEKCPNECGKKDARGDCYPEIGCRCNEGYKGDDCSQLEINGYWEIVNVPDYIPPGSASHGAAVWRDSMYVIGGENYDNERTKSDMLFYMYDFNGRVWETAHISGSPSSRYGHSTVVYGDKIFIYGGVVGTSGPTSELWAFDISAKTWENVTVKENKCNGSFLACGPLKSAGHTATVVINNTNKKSDRMVVIFGHSPNFGYLNTVQEYYFGTREWHIVSTKGFPVKGGYGHTASWDPLTQKIYVYGGVISESESAQVLTKNLYMYDPYTREWTSRKNAPSARFLHTATFVSSGLMLVFGGNTHNDTSLSYGAKCYSAELLAYDVECDSWQVLEVPKSIDADLARFGHSAVVFEGSLYVYGGFDGQMLSDTLRYTPGKCSFYTTMNTCLSTKSGVKCMWDMETSKCNPIQPLSKNMTTNSNGNINTCPALNRTAKTNDLLQNTHKCNSMEDCQSCVHTSSNCVWCGNCSYETCRNNSYPLLVDRLHPQCPADVTPICKHLHTCTACTSQPFCRWRYEHARCEPSNASETTEPIQCQKVCSEFNLCVNCTQEECIWCQNEGRCVDKNAYTSSFPYGQCREWTTVSSKCRSRGDEEKSQCSFPTCAQCRDDPACGWCDDGSRTGLGRCMPGGYAGPNSDLSPLGSCPSDHWHFTTCPVCQCNGHASCIGNTSVCQPCSNTTTGPHCEHCIRGYWGDPVNGGACKPCECNAQAKECHPETGKCYCTTKGLNGDHCEKCDTTNHYHADSVNKGCYYDLTIDYQFTFNLSKKEDRHYTQINFRNSPIKADIDADFSITCSVLAKMNITMRTLRMGNSKEEKYLYTAENCSTSFKTKFPRSEYSFGVEDNVTLTTFYVYVYDFQPPLWIQISFSQYPKLNLQQFFITFSSCFLLLLLFAGILWKIKQRYDIYRRRQRMFVEMEQMASRPFSQVLVELEMKDLHEPDATITILNDKRKKRDSPSPIALEPCSGNRAAVLSLMVRLPTGGESYTVRGQSAGLAIASALVTLGNPRKMSVDQVKMESKGGKSRKAQSQHPDSCL